MRLASHSSIPATRVGVDTARPANTTVCTRCGMPRRTRRDRADSGLCRSCRELLDYEAREATS